MLAAVLRGIDRLSLEEMPKPEPGPGGVVVRVVACGVCATDWKAVRGVRRNVAFPFVPGHEPAGVVDAVGPGVTAFRPGDEVVVMPSGYCGLCPACRDGLTHYCRSASTTGGDGPVEVLPGAFAEYLLTRETSVFPKPAGVPFEAACLAEPLSGAWKGVIAASELRLGEDVVVIGAGGIGLLCAMVARAAGAGRVAVVDKSAYARASALRLGANDAIDPGDGDPREAVYRAMPGGPDLVIEAAGPIEAVRLMAALRRRGTRWNVFGVTTHETFELDGGLTHFLEGRMDASFGTHPRAMQQALRLMERGLVDPGRIVSHRFALRDIGAAMDQMDRPDRNKVVVLP